MSQIALINSAPLEMAPVIIPFIYFIFVANKIKL